MQHVLMLYSDSAMMQCSDLTSQLDLVTAFTAITLGCTRHKPGGLFHPHPVDACQHVGM